MSATPENSYHTAIERAIQNAQPFPVYAEIPPEENPFLDASDDMRMLVHAEFDVVLGAHQVATPNDAPSQLETLLRAWSHVTGHKIDAQHIEETARHEGHHAQAAAILGAVGTRFLLSTYYTDTDGPQTLTYIPTTLYKDFSTTKLGIALVFGHPLNLSSSDLDFIRVFNYSGIDELAELAISRNSKRTGDNDQFYPVPMSYTGNVSEWLAEE